MLNYCALVLAIEFPVTELGVAKHQHYFDRSLTQALANQLAFEIGKHLPSLEGLGLVWMAACYDQAQVLRPNFPLHTSLFELYRAGIRDGQLPQVMTLQALRGDAPLPGLAVDEKLLGGPLVLVPFALVGEAEQIAASKAILESKLLDAGLTDARTAMMLNQALGADAEHARLMTLDDLAAMCSIQLSNAGLDDAWRLLEAALFDTEAAPQSVTLGSIQFELLAEEPNEKVAILSIPSFSGTDLPDAEFATQLMLARQTSAVLGAHGVETKIRIAAYGNLQETEHYWLDVHAQVPATRIEVLKSSSAGPIGYNLLDASNSRVAWAFPKTPAGHFAFLEEHALLTVKTQHI